MLKKHEFYIGWKIDKRENVLGHPIRMIPIDFKNKLSEHNIRQGFEVDHENIEQFYWQES